MRAAAVMLSLPSLVACLAHARLTGPGYPRHPASAVDICVAETMRKQNSDLLWDTLMRCETKVPGPTEDECGVTNPQALQDMLACVNRSAPSTEDTPARIEEARRQCVQQSSNENSNATASKAERVAYDADKLERCLSKARAARHGKSAKEILDIPEGDPDCQAVLVPLASEGDTCDLDYECPVGTSCVAAVPTVQKLTCLRPATVGEQCATRACDSDSVCVKSRCERRRAIGQTCAYLKLDTDGCVFGAVCNKAADRCEKARPPAALGEACGECQKGLSCLDNRCVADHSVPDGKACTGDVQCAGNCSSCNAAKSGSAARVCATRGRAHEACAQDRDCVSGFRCTAEADAGTSQAVTNRVGECVALLRKGEKCAKGSECGQGLFCDLRNGCTEPQAEGQPCSGRNTCAEKLECLSGVCRPKPEGEGDLVGEGTAITWRPRAAVGEACTADGGTLAPCGADLYCEDGRCQQRAPAGAPCTTDDQCESKTCLAAEHACKAVPADGCAGKRDHFSNLFPLAVVFAPRLRRRRRARVSHIPKVAILATGRS
jgi:hypothetical protein